VSTLCLADFWPDSLLLLPALVFLWIGWIAERQKTRERIAANAAGGLCRHGRSKFRLCRDCAREFAAAESIDASPAAPSSTRDVERVLTGAIGAGSAVANLLGGGVIGSIAGTVAGVGAGIALTRPLRNVVRFIHNGQGARQLNIQRPVVLRSLRTPLSFRYRRGYGDGVALAGDWFHSSAEGVALLAVPGDWFIEVLSAGVGAVEFECIDAATNVPTL